MQEIFKLKGKVQHYSWGGFDYIPQLLHQNNTEGKPFAEYWLGAHPLHSSTVVREANTVALSTLFPEEADAILGNTVSKQFEGLPYLLKVLDVRQMLSIQVHPSKQEAVKGYRREEEAGIPISAAHRNYKDENHKPELMVALSPFWLLHGFKSEAALKKILAATPELKVFLPLFEAEGYKALYEKLMAMPQEEVNTYIAPLAKRVMPLYETGQLAKHTEDFWAARAIQTFCKEGQYDRGLFSIYCFNLLELQKGEGIFQPASLPHAYLEGQNVEIMANSDNVLRAGLTEKYIDVPELLRHTTFAATIPTVIRPTGRVTFYKAPVPEFSLYQYELEKGTQIKWETQSVEIYIVLEGVVELQGNEGAVSFYQGEAAIAYAYTSITLTSLGNTKLFRATVGNL